MRLKKEKEILKRKGGINAFNNSTEKKFSGFTLNGLSVPGMIGSLARIRNRVTLSQSSCRKKNISNHYCVL
jgi:hypothetical protein